MSGFPYVSRRWVLAAVAGQPGGCSCGRGRPRIESPAATSFSRAAFALCAIGLACSPKPAENPPARVYPDLHIYDFPAGTPWFTAWITGEEADLPRRAWYTRDRDDGGVAEECTVEWSASRKTVTLEHPPLEEGMYYLHIPWPLADGGTLEYAYETPVTLSGVFPWSEMLWPQSRSTNGCVPRAAATGAVLYCVANGYERGAAGALHEFRFHGARTTWQRIWGPWLEADVQGWMLGTLVSVAGEQTYVAAVGEYNNFARGVGVDHAVLSSPIADMPDGLRLVGQVGGGVCGLAGFPTNEGDVVLASTPWVSSIRVFTPNASGTWVASDVAVDEPVTPCGLTAVDLDGDGETELVATSPHGLGVGILRWDRTEPSRFRLLQDTFRLGPWPRMAPILNDIQIVPFVGDINGDETPDIVLSQWGAVEIWFNDSTPGNMVFDRREYSWEGTAANVGAVWLPDERKTLLVGPLAMELVGREELRPAYQRQQVGKWGLAVPPNIFDIDLDGHMDLVVRTGPAYASFWREPTPDMPPPEYIYLDGDGGVLDASVF